MNLTNAQRTSIWRKSFKGKLSDIYHHMKLRVNGKCMHPHHYEGLPICSREEFFVFSENDLVYQKIHQKWVETNFDPFYKPSIDRIIPAKGYVIGNIRWLTEHDNKQRHLADLSKYDNINENEGLSFYI